jgi:hypothetical protein
MKSTYIYGSRIHKPTPSIAKTMTDYNTQCVSELKPKQSITNRNLNLNTRKKVLTIA